MKWTNFDRGKILYRFAKFTFPFRFFVAWLCRILVKMKKVRLIFVFGMSRSGTTFLGNVLTLDNKQSVYVHEPVKHLLSIQFQEQNHSMPFWEYVFVEERKSIKVHFLVCSVLRYVLSRGLKTGDVLCIKPISMVDCIEETFNTLGGSILFISRHPCGRTESIIRQRKIENTEPPGIQELTDLGREWGKIHHVVQQQFNRHEDWMWIYFEYLCENPHEEIRSLYEKYNLDWSDLVEEQIVNMTTTNSTDFYETNRNSKAQINKWKSALTRKQVEAIRAGTVHFKTELYKGF